MGKQSKRENKTIYQICREEAGLTRSEASEKMTTVSDSKIEKFEYEIQEPTPYDIIQMADAYRRPDLCNYYCSHKCEIGHRYVPEVKVSDLSNIILETIASLNEINPLTTRLIQIARDGRISASQMLERFLFTPEMQYAPIGKLSGGEKRRLYLLGVLCQNINVLLLDEASNNLDIPTMTILEDYLNSFVGIVVAVSHDRYFLDNVADRILEFDGQGHIRQYEGGYTDYLEAHEKRFGTAPDMSLNNKTKADSGEKKNNSKDWKQNRPVKLKFTFSEQKEFDTIDDDIAALEAKIEQIDADMMKFATDSGKLNDLMKEKDANESALEEKMDRWVYLNDLAEQIEAQKSGN